MNLNIKSFFRATNPSRTLDTENEEDQKYYIDFSLVRGGKIIEELKNNITFFSPDEPTCALFTGHIGCGKSTELLRLKADLEDEEFHVVYFESSTDLEMGDVDIGDILLAIARRVSDSLNHLSQVGIDEFKNLKNILRDIAKLLQTEIELSAEASIPLGIGKITAKTKNSPELRNKLREYLEPRTTKIIEAINQDLLQSAKERLKQYRKKGLVVIVDNLDRVENRNKPWGRPQQEYLFIDRGEQLRQLKCHVIYTMPLGLLFSNDLNRLTSRFGVDPKVLPMVPVKLRDGSECSEGMALLRQMVLARAFPNLKPQQRLTLVKEIFDSEQSLDYLCRISGGHVRELLRLLNDWIKKHRELPLSYQELENVIRYRRNQMIFAITDNEWALLRYVQERRQVSGNDGYQTLIRSMFVYEYRDYNGSWFEVNPILAESEKLNS